MTALQPGDEVRCAFCAGEDDWTSAARHPVRVLWLVPELDEVYLSVCRPCTETRKGAGVRAVSVTALRASQLQAQLQQARTEEERRTRAASRMFKWWRVRMLPERAAEITDGRPLYLSRLSAGSSKSWTPDVSQAETWAEHEAATANLVAGDMGELESFEARLPDGEKLPALGGGWRPHHAAGDPT